MENYPRNGRLDFNVCIKPHGFNDMNFVSTKYLTCHYWKTSDILETTNKNHNVMLPVRMLFFIT